ncbi:hypothetical protein CEQ90_17610 [Lewinellaceae bacterium SD302]|nr:hypothetical protein CEQ90_17610 [Lewinellaceae bacterium SD302]
MRLHFLALVAFLFPAVVSSQNLLLVEPRNELVFTLGLHRGFFNDANYSPLHQQSVGPEFELSYQRNTADGNRYSVGFGATLATLSTSVDDEEKATRPVINLHVGWQKGLAGNTPDRRLYVGVNFRSNADVTLYDGDESVTWFALHAFEGAAAGAWRVGKKHGINAEVAVPFFGLLSRPPYSGFDKFISDNSDNLFKILTRGSWTSLNNFFGIRGELGYAYQITDRWFMQAKYGLNYYTTQRQDRTRIFNNSLSLSSSHKF